MNGIFYDPEDELFIAMTLRFLEHRPACKECIEGTNPKNYEMEVKLFEVLNSISMHDIAFKDYEAARHFCERWLEISEILKMVDGLTGELHGTVQ